MLGVMGATDELRKLGERPNAAAVCSTRTRSAATSRVCARSPTAMAITPCASTRCAGSASSRAMRHALRCAKFTHATRPGHQGSRAARHADREDEQGVLALYRASKTSRREALAAAHAFDDGWRCRVAGDRCRTGEEVMNIQNDSRRGAPGHARARVSGTSAELTLPRDGWASWEVDAVEGAPSWCCWRIGTSATQREASCNLDHEGGNFGTRDHATTDAVRFTRGLPAARSTDCGRCPRRARWKPRRRFALST